MTIRPAALALLFILLLPAPQDGKQQSNREPGRNNGQSQPQQPNAQPSDTRIEKGQEQVDLATQNEAKRQEQEREAKEAAFKVAQLRQNGVIVTATVWIAIFSGLSFLAVIIYTVVSLLQWREIKKQAGHAGEQVRAMKEQLNAMKDQVSIMRESISETRNLVIQGERAIEVSELNATTAQESLYVSERAYIGIRNIEMSVSSDQPSLTITWINGGKTPAWHFRAEPILVLSEKRETGKINFIDDSYTTDISGSFLPAKAERVERYRPEKDIRITAEVWEELRNGSKTLSVIGAAYYVDFRGCEQTYPIEAVCEVGPFSNRFVETYQYGGPKKKPN